MEARLLPTYYAPSLSWELGICASLKIAQCSGTSPAAQARTSRQCVPSVCSGEHSFSMAGGLQTLAPSWNPGKGRKLGTSERHREGQRAPRGAETGGGGTG